MAGPYEQNYVVLNRLRDRLLVHDLRDARYYNVNGSLMPRQVSETLGYGVHRSGWSACVEHISRANLPVLVDDFVERTFMAREAKHVHRRKFLGIFHYPPDSDLPNFVPRDSDITQSSVFGTRAWKESQKNLIAGVCLTAFLAADLRSRFDVPIHVIDHPTETDVKSWDLRLFLDNPTILQVGAFYRDTRIIARTNAPAFKKIRLLDLRYDWINQWDKLVGGILGPHILPSDILHINRVDDGLYDDLLSSCVIQTRYLAASATNVVVEAIVRNTPCLVNRHPAIVEYLGNEYPLYEEDVEGHDLIDRSKAANAYLKRIDKRKFSFDEFRARLTSVLS